MSPAPEPRRGPAALLVPMRGVLRVGGVAAVVGLFLAGALGWLLGGAGPALGGLIGMGIAVAFFAVTVVVALLTAGMDPARLGLWVLGSWLVKVVLVMVVLAILREATFYSRGALFGALLLGTVGSLVLESLVVVRARVPYVEPDPR